MISKILQIVLLVIAYGISNSHAASITVKVSESSSIPVVIHAEWKCGGFHTTSNCGSKTIVKYLKKPTSVSMLPPLGDAVFTGMLGLNVFDPKFTIYNPFYLFHANHLYEAFSKDDKVARSRSDEVINLNNHLDAEKLEALYPGALPGFSVQVIQKHISNIIKYIEYMQELEESVPDEVMPFTKKLYNIGIEILDKQDTFYPSGFYKTGKPRMSNVEMRKYYLTEQLKKKLNFS